MFSLSKNQKFNSKDNSRITMKNISYVSSGNIGDVCYALPVSMALMKQRGFEKADFYLKIDVPAVYFGVHPLGNIRMNQKAAAMLRPLLEAQSWINRVFIVKTNPACEFVNLDAFREVLNFPLSAGNIAQWYNPTFPDLTDPPSLEAPWLENVTPISLPGKDIIIFRSARYRISDLDYGFLRRIAHRIVFIGLESEHADFQQKFFRVDRVQIRDFKHAAQIIKGAKLIIGNQTFFFSLAEALKVPRMLETSPVCPNVIMAGGHFQYIISPYQFQASFPHFYRKFIDPSYQQKARP